MTKHKVVRNVQRLFKILFALTFALPIVAAPQPVLSASITVPGQYSSIQAAIDAAADGDTIIIAPGVYNETITLDKSVTLQGETYDMENPRNNTTILDGGGETVITIVDDLDPGPTLTGLVIRNGDDGISPRSPFTIEYSYFTGSKDQIDYEKGSGGLCRYNIFENAGDDAIDLDHPNVNLIIEYNVLWQSGNDGIEIRLQDSPVDQLAETIIRYNEISGSEEDGIQFIDYYEDTNRRFTIERNLFLNNGMAGIGLMDDATSDEDYRAADITERIQVFNNTFVGNEYGISGGDNLIALNNIFQGHVVALNKIDGDSIVSYNLFWQNETDNQGSNVEAATTLYADPLLDDQYQLQAGSPAIDTGTAQFTWLGELVFDLPPDSYAGAAPDMGRGESAAVEPPPTETPTSLPTPTSTLTPTSSPMPTLTPTPLPPTPTPSPTLPPTPSPTPSTETPQLLAVRVAASEDDAEERVDGKVYLGSSDLELVRDQDEDRDRGDQAVGLRFANVTVPPGATIISATIQFQADEVSSEPTSLTFWGEASGNAAAFAEVDFNISSRAKTAASVLWSPPAWTTRGEAGAAQRTPALSALIQEIVARPDWQSGNALAILISGSGLRSAKAFDGSSEAAPLLQIEYLPSRREAPVGEPAVQLPPHRLFVPALANDSR